MHPVEMEVKFHIADPERLHRQIAGFCELRTARILEINHVFEDAGQNLKKRHALLRLRRDKEARLTLKTPLPQASHEVKARRELEVAVSDPDTMHQILTGLGYAVSQVYEKYRETWAIGPTLLCIDQMPFGSFLEIEGDPDAIRGIAERLELIWPERILLSYLKIFTIIKSARALPFNDVTFDHFKDWPVDIRPLLASFYAG